MAITYDQLLDLAQSFAGEEISTVRGTTFTVSIYRDSLVFVPGSTRLGRSDGRKASEYFLERYNATGSLRITDYQDVTRNASYLVALLIAGQAKSRD